MSYGDCVEMLGSEVGIGEGFFENGLNRFDMGTGGNFRYNSTVSGVNIDLRDDDIGKDFAAIFDDGGGSFVARGFNSQDFH